MKKMIILAGIFLFGVMHAYAAAPSFNTCKNYYEGRNFTGARDCSASIVKLHPGDVQARYLYATALIYTQEYDKSLYQYTYIKKRYPNTPAGKMAAEQIKFVSNKKSNAMAAPKSDYGHYIDKLDLKIKWDTMPVRVWVQPSKYSNSVYNAFAEWQYATGGVVKFMKTSYESQAKIKVYFVTKLDSGGDKAGLCQFQYVGKSLQEANIYLLYKSDNGVILTPQQIYPIALHEIGHSIGIDGHSDSKNDVMYPNTDIIGIHTSRRDVNTIKTLYKK